MAMSVPRGGNASRLTFCIPRNHLDCPGSILAPGKTAMNCFSTGRLVKSEKGKGTYQDVAVPQLSTPGFTENLIPVARSGQAYTDWLEAVAWKLSVISTI
jgi:hypothetical protein